MDVAKWNKQFKQATKIVLQVSKETIKETSVKLFSKMVEYTPVGNPTIWHHPYVPHGYKPGTLKKSWEINFQPTEVIIKNAQPYAERVEYGWSSQAPYGMMRRSIAEFPSLLSQVANKNKK